VAYRLTYPQSCKIQATGLPVDPRRKTWRLVLSAFRAGRWVWPNRKAKSWKWKTMGGASLRQKRKHLLAIPWLPT
jgi:hypothetical protein